MEVTNEQEVWREGNDHGPRRRKMGQVEKKADPHIPWIQSAFPAILKSPR